MLALIERFSRWKNLIFILAYLNIKKRYKQRYLRAAWAVINPLFTMLIFTVVFSRVAKLPSEGVPYPVFNFTALIPWTFFAASMSFCVYSLNAQSSLITRINFPKITIPLGSILATAFDFLIGLALLIIMYFIYKVYIDYTVFFIIPILIIQLMFTVGAGLIISITNVYMRDIQNALPLILQAWMLVSPVGYSLDMVGDKFKFFYLLNPMAGIIDSYRQVLLHHRAPNFYYLGMSFFVSLGVLIFGYWFFKRNEAYVTDVVSL
jgi:lipopolysaccharide transport system permease protein